MRISGIVVVSSIAIPETVSLSSLQFQVSHNTTCMQPVTCKWVYGVYPFTSYRLHTRNSSGDETTNINFLYDDIVHVLQITIDSCINSATDRLAYVLERIFTKFSEITQCNGHYAVQSHSRSQILVPIESSYTTSC